MNEVWLIVKYWIREEDFMKVRYAAIGLALTVGSCIAVIAVKLAYGGC